MNSKDNGHIPKRAALYIWVSTDEQAKRGYSVPDQLRELRREAGHRGYRVVEEVIDDGYSGATLERPGLRRVIELAEGGEIDVVLATKRDRYFRSRLKRLLLDEDFKEYGVDIKALNDTGNRIGDGVQDDFAEWEREQITDRTIAGKKQKARGGKIVAPRKPAYGFKLNENRDSYEIDEDAMAVIRRIFELVANGNSLKLVKKTLEDERIPAPYGGTTWNTSTVRYILKSDLYFPYTPEEVKVLANAEQTLFLQSGNGHYGIWWASRYESRTEMAKKNGRLKPRKEWVAVPVPGSGIPREVAARARHNMENNPRHVNKARRVWELAGGLLYCAECGRSMSAHTIAPKGRKSYHYYRCPRKEEERWEACPNKGHNAEKLEKQVGEMVGRLLANPEEAERLIEERIEKERRRDPDKEALAWAKKLEESRKLRAAYQNQQAAGLMTLEELGERLKKLEGEREIAERELEAARNRQGRIMALENEAKIVLAWFSGMAAARLDLFPPEERQRMYRALGLRATVNREGEVRVEIAGGDYLPDVEQARRVVEGIMSSKRRS